MRRRRPNLVAAMACVVAFCTVTALIRPAMTLEQASCEKPEHTHTAECYTQLTSVSRRVPVCGCTDFVVHQHDAACYGADGVLWCTLPEVEEHTHDAGCYAVPEAHTHADGCYGLTQGELICTEHVHTEECYTESRNLLCTLEDCDGHLHDDSCRDEAGELVCGQEESEGHHHTEDCFEVQRELTCGNPGNHEHTDECYEQMKTLICDLPEEQAEPVLVCEKPEVILHEHTADCLDENDSVICGQEQVLQHQHTEACFETVEEPADTETLTCTSTDPKHVHGPLCYGTWVLSCELEEHTHSAECGGEPTGPEETTDGALTQDGAVVSELNVDAEEGAALPWMVRGGQSAVYRISVKTASLTEETYTQGRVRLELVLPLSADVAVFDLTAMTWLDQTEGYAPQITEETRVIDEEDRPCQVLTGYVLLTAIPGEFSADAVIQVLAAAPEKTAALQVSGAMEHNQWDGDCELHQIPEKLTVTAPGFLPVCSEEEAKGFYAQYLLEVEALEAAPDTGAAEALMERLRQAFQLGQLTQEGYAQLYERVFTLLYGSPDTIAEQALGSNWILLRDSGWFEAYSGYSGGRLARSARAFRAVQPAAAFGLRSQMPSDVQVCDRGGTNANIDDGVSVSKTIAGTDLENVFDITLRVQTNQKISEITSEPDMAVVIVMDISNTMKSSFGGVTRYAAAMVAAENFLDQFAAHNALGNSKVGFVAFNTNAQQIFGLQSCADQAQANALKNTMRTRTGNIINAAGYDASHSRFTNIEAGLALASDMLSGASNKNKFIIFLSDGFPTTYVSSGYSGYDPYDSTGDHFYDRVLNKYCKYGTSYSDKAAFMAQLKAKGIKKSGTTIFSIGVDVGGQTIQKYITQSEEANGYSVVDRDTTSYVIGDANSSDSYKNWLREKIGSGYYYDSTDSSGLSGAFDQIFAEIKRKVTEASKADWVAADPMPSEYVEFIRFYDQSANLTPGPLAGTAAENGENTASFDGGQNAIFWDLKHSGYQVSSDGSTTTYTYQLVYRVRLANELAGFTEGSVYDTNGSTTLRYRVVRTVDDSAAISDPKTLAFPIPSVQGYLSQLTFTKRSSSGTPLQGAEFTLRHDARSCHLCRGDGTSVAVAEQSAVSGADGSVAFTAIPSGHSYTLTETKAPDGYVPTGNTYQVTVAYDCITVDVQDINGGKLDWDGTVTNNSYYALPDTGGAGTNLYTMGGCLLLAAAAYLLLYSRIRRGKEDFTSF